MNSHGRREIYFDPRTARDAVMIREMMFGTTKKGGVISPTDNPGNRGVLHTLLDA
jgi:hypothetical protein